MGTDYRTFHECPLARVAPTGWLARMLEGQRDGLTGHLEVAGFPFNTAGWRSNRIKAKGHDSKSWWPYEQVAYWVDGMIRCGHLLGDRTLLAKGRRQTDWVLSHPGRDGYLGPSSLREAQGDRYFHCNRWPHTVLFRALMAEYSATGRKSILNKLRRHYVSGAGDYSLGRNVLNVEIMVWLYHETGDAKLLDLALQQYGAYQARYPEHDTTVDRMLSDQSPRDHGVNYNEHAKLAALLYGATGDRRLLKASRKALAKLARDHELVSGVPSSTEHLRGIYSTAGYEICNIADYTWTLGYLLMITGEAAYADRIERAVFNAAPGAITKDFTALQYFSSPNQVVADRSSNHHPHGTGSMHVSYRPRPGTECCPGNVNRIFPNYISRMWMTDREGGLVAALYGPGRVRWKAGPERVPVTVHQQTDYPFRETIAFDFQCRQPVAFRFSVRIPGWCRHATITVNGKPLKRSCKPGTFVRIQRTFASGDQVVLTLPMAVQTSAWPEGGLAIERGPLVFALPVKASRRRDQRDPHASDNFPAWNLRPIGRWNVGVDPLAKIEVQEHPLTGNPWDPEKPPITLALPGRIIPGWKLIEKKTLKVHWGGRDHLHKGDYRFMPALPGAKARQRAGLTLQPLTLVPFGSTLLRISIFPRLEKPSGSSGRC
ncbi:MAG: glycoside hydrolase family 127 protein [Kiritimatiellae bacterium]|nr:glycoside hydrolase family 127 protein [Kiritimatiellia bacterium]